MCGVSANWESTSARTFSPSTTNCLKACECDVISDSNTSARGGCTGINRMNAKFVLTLRARRPNSGDSLKAPNILLIRGMQLAYLLHRLNMRSGAFEAGSQNKLAMEPDEVLDGDAVAGDLEAFCD